MLFPELIINDYDIDPSLSYSDSIMSFQKDDLKQISSLLKDDFTELDFTHDNYIKFILWNVNGGGVEIKKNFDKKILIRALFPDFIFLVEPWIEYNFNNDSYISYSSEPVNGKLSVQLLIKEKLTSKLITKNQTDTILVEVQLENN